MLLASESSTTLAAPTDAVPAAPPALRATTPLLQSLGLTGLKRSDTPADRRAGEALDTHISGVVSQAHALVDRAPESAMAWGRLAQALHNANLPDEAIAAARQALSCPPEGEQSQGLRYSAAYEADVPAVYVAATVLAGTGNSEEASQALARIKKPGEHRVLAAALAAEREDYIRAFAILEGMESAAAQTLRGWLWLRQNAPQRAVAEFRKTLQMHEPSPGITTNLAYAYAWLGSRKKAIRAAQEAVFLAPFSHTASFNLVGYLQHNGEYDRALAELDRLSNALDGPDVDMLLARAGVLLRSDNEKGALQALRSGRSWHALRGSKRAHAELVANAAFLEWRAGMRSRESLFREVRAQITLAAGQSVPLVLMLSDLFDGNTSAAPEVYAAYEAVRQTVDSANELFPLECRLAQLAGEFERATDIAAKWAASEPLDAQAAAAAVHLEAQVLGNYQLAAKRGLEALRRMPTSLSLRNNTAFALALAGDGVAAERVLGHAVGTQDSPVFTATRGLAAIARGHVDRGCSLYEQAMEQATALPDGPSRDKLRALIALNEILVLHRFGATTAAQAGRALEVQLPSDWRNDMSFLLLRLVADREGSPWPE